VPPDSPLHGIADLKGKKIAFNKGSNVHYFVVKALEKAGLNYTDVEPVFLPPADARAAFEDQTDLIQFLLSLDDAPQVLLEAPASANHPVSIQLHKPV